ncbi:MAG: methyltransferase domain-containing protein [Polyangiales bacterium]
MSAREPPLGHALYARPRYYDHAFRAHRRDLAHYVALAQRARGPVLELGAGTGRVTLALLRAGASVTAVDRSEAMLARARERVVRLPQTQRERLTLRAGDLRQLRLRETFPLVIAPFNLLMHMYNPRDIAAALACVREHLAPRGLFAFDVLMPDLGVLRRPADRFYRCRPVLDPSDGHRYAYAEQFAYDAATQLQTVSMHFQRLDKPEIERITQLVLRFFFPQELRALLEHHGFSIVRHEGDFAGEPLSADSESQVVVAKLSAARVRHGR